MPRPAIYARARIWQICFSMAKRMLTRFDRGAFPTYERIEEDGYPQPCALGQPWVNPDTQKTIRKRGGVRTDAFGRPLPPNEERPGG